jgi:flagellar motor protein MotB
MKYRRWEKRREPASHIDDWLMTYADLITLLLCFFAIFVTVSLPKIEAAQKAQIAKVIEQPVKPPETILEGNLPFHGRAQADFPTDRIAAQPDIPKDVVMTVPLTNVPETRPIENKTPDLPPVIANPPVLPDTSTLLQTYENPPAPPAPPAPAPAADASLTKIIDHLKSQGPATIEQKGDRLTTIEVNSAAFFGSGSATLSEGGKSALHDVAATIKSNKFKDYRVTVEGHTDDAPIKTAQFPSNWELSTARASAVVHFFLEQGIPAQRLRAAGYADTFPKVPNRDANGNPIPANQAQNRRVVIKLEKIDKTSGD